MANHKNPGAWSGSRRFAESPTREQFARVTLGILSSRTGDRLTVKLAAALVAMNAEPLRRLVVDALEAGVTAVDLDLTGCERADSRGLCALVQIGSRCARRGVELTIVGVSSTVFTQMRFAGPGGITRLFTFAPGAVGETGAFPSTPTSAEAFHA